MATKLKRPRDPFQLAKLIGDISTGQAEDQDANAGKNSKKILSGSKGGSLGGAARADKLTAKKRVEIAKKAANKRWGKAA